MNKKTAEKPITSIQEIIRPVMQLRALLDRISTIALRKKMGFGISHFRILYVLAFKTNMTQRDIADYWDVTEASISRQVNILREKGLVEKKPSTALTPKGRKTLDEALRQATITFENVFSEVRESDRKNAVTILGRLSSDAKKYLSIFDETAKEIRNENKFRRE
jgi:DNA-binding MarR family transcriptional regulator